MLLRTDVVGRRIAKGPGADVIRHEGVLVYHALAGRGDGAARGKQAKLKDIEWSCLVSLTIDVELPTVLARFKLPTAVASRLQSLLDRQDAGDSLTADECAEAEGLADLADLLTLLRLRAERCCR